MLDYEREAATWAEGICPHCGGDVRIDQVYHGRVRPWTCGKREEDEYEYRCSDCGTLLDEADLVLSEWDYWGDDDTDSCDFQSYPNDVWKDDEW